MTDPRAGPSDQGAQLAVGLRLPRLRAALPGVEATGRGLETPAEDRQIVRGAPRQSTDTLSAQLREEGRGLFWDVALLLQDPILLPHPRQLLTLRGRKPRAYLRPIRSGPLDPVAQRSR